MTAPLTINDLARARVLAQDLLLHAVNDVHGRDESDPVYRRITENRDGPTPALRARYSSCGDLAHWLLRCLGVRANWLNRDDDGSADWRSGVNLNWLCPPPIGKCGLAYPRLHGAPATGDVFVENNVYGGHVFCAIDYNATTDTLTTAEYGQPGGKMKKRAGFTAAFGLRPLSHLQLEDVLSRGACTAPPDYSPITGTLPPPVPSSPYPTLRKGSKGTHVALIQTLMGLKADGDFGPTTEAAVKRAQSGAGLVADGVVGPKTWKAFGFA